MINDYDVSELFILYIQFNNNTLAMPEMNLFTAYTVDRWDKGQQ